jgi:hypothetical protein
MKIDLSILGEVAKPSEIKKKKVPRTARERARQCWVCCDVLQLRRGDYVWNYFHCTGYKPWRRGYAGMSRTLHDELAKRTP